MEEVKDYSEIHTVHERYLLVGAWLWFQRWVQFGLSKLGSTCTEAYIEATEVSFWFKWVCSNVDMVWTFSHRWIFFFFFFLSIDHLFLFILKATRFVNVNLFFNNKQKLQWNIVLLCLLDHHPYNFAFVWYGWNI